MNAVPILKIIVPLIVIFAAWASDLKVYTGSKKDDETVLHWWVEKGLLVLFLGGVGTILYHEIKFLLWIHGYYRPIYALLGP